MWKVILSLAGLNVVLIGYLVTSVHQPRPRPGPEPLATATETNPPQQVTFKARTPAKSKPISWASVASPDLHKYAANLRQVGCPEETIKEIMLAEVGRLYSTKERALKVRDDDVAPWEKQPLYDRRSSETKLRQLLEEKRSLLKELTGTDVGIDMPSRLAGRDLGKFEGAISSLPQEKQDQVRGIQENYWAGSDDIKQRTMGYLEPEDREEFMRIKNERHDALAKVMTPQELQDYEMKTSDTTAGLRTRMQGFDVTDEEFRKVFDFLQPLDDQYSLTRRNPDPEDAEFTKSRTEAEKALNDQIHSVLGDDRYAEYQRSRDPVYRAISKAGTDAGVPKDAIVQAYQAQQQLQAEAQRVVQDASLTPEQRAQSLQSMQGKAQEAFQQIFGDKGAQILQRLPANRMAERYGLPMNNLPVISTPVISVPTLGHP